MLRTWSGSPLVVSTVAGGAVSQVRGMKPKKKNKFGPQFVKESQPWREEWRQQREVRLAEGLRKYVLDSSTARRQPYDTRFAPFDREERDGVYLVMKHLMGDKLNLTHNHANPVKRLFCNVGLVGPTVSTRARWKPKDSAFLPAKTSSKE
uniref:Uncharacterized protein n=1 Tax=Neobodo designis TaxID=312471 RepID=A0A7S1QVN7_NEODS